nr:hypothetical protein [Tanacetum cinerariifolium]
MLSGFFQNQSSTSGTLPSNTIPNPKGEMKAITTRSGVAYDGPSIPTPKKVVERETKETTNKEQTNFQGSTAHIQPSVTPISEPDVPKTLPKPNIPYPLRLNDQKLREKATNQMEKFFQIFQDLHFDISFAMLLKKLPEKLGDPGKFFIPCDFPRMDTMRYSSTYDDVSVNRIDIIDVAREEYAQEILGFFNNSLGGNPTSTFEPILFYSSLSLTPFEGSNYILEEINAYLKDESISQKLTMPIKKLSLLKLTPTQMTLELADRSITRPKEVAEDVFVKVGKFHFLTDFVVVDFKANPWVRLILGRSFLRTGCALIDVDGEKTTLRVNDKAVTFNLNQTTRYSSTYDDLSVNRIDIIDVAREEYVQEILGFSKNSSSGNPTSTSEPIISDSSPTLTPFEGSDFILEEIEAYLKD